MKKCIRRFFLGLASALPLLVLPISASAQASACDDPASAADCLHPLQRLLAGSDNIGDLLQFRAGRDQRWDPVAGHYRGTMPELLRYPQIAKAGYRSFSVVKSKDYDARPGFGSGTFEQDMDEAARVFNRNDRRKSQRWYFDDSGRLRAVVTATIYPESEGFEETSDSLFYYLQPDGSGSILVKRDMLNTFFGAEDMDGCPGLRGFHRVVVRRLDEITLDAWQNVTATHTRMETIVDSCRGTGAEISSLVYSYDAIGRRTRNTAGNSQYAGTPYETRYRYIDLSLASFDSSASADYRYASLREEPIRTWLSAHGPLNIVFECRQDLNYLHFDKTLNRDVLRSDSPRVFYDTAMYIVNSRQERMVLRTPGRRPSLAFYTRQPRSKSLDAVLQVQEIPLRASPGQPNANVCFPLATSRILSQKSVAEPHGTDTLLRFYEASSEDQYRSRSTGTQQFSPAIGDDMPYSVQSMLLTDRQGLVRLIWQRDGAIKITYP